MSDNPNHETDAIQDKKPQSCFSRSGCIVITLLLMGAFALLFCAAQEAREDARRMQCIPKQIALVLWNYHDTYQSLPPAYTTDVDGKPLHSWRVLVLPFMEQNGLYNEIRLNEPWDSPYNSQFHDRMPSSYYCPSRPTEEQTKGLTPYQMIIGPDTISNGPNGTNFSNVTRDRGNTLLFVEASVSVPWMKPEDLPQSALKNGVVSLVSQRGQPVVQGIGSPHYHRRHFWQKKTVGANIAYADGSCDFFTSDMSPEELLEKSRIRKPE